MFFTSEIKVLQLRKMPASRSVWILHTYVFGIGSSYTYFWHYLFYFDSVLSKVWVLVRFGFGSFPITTFEVDLADSGHGVNQPGDDLFDPLSSKWGHGRVLPIVSLLCPSVFDLGSGTGQTDRQRPSMHNAPTLWGRGYNEF